MAKKKNSFNTVTPLSKTLAMILFIALPFLGFYLGVTYQKFISSSTTVNGKLSMSAKPTQITQSFYENYVTCLNNHFENPTGKTPKEDCPIENNPNISSDFVLNISGNIGGDPVLCAQNTPESVTTSLLATSGNAATVIVHEKFDTVNDITVNLQKIGNVWKLDNVVCPQSTTNSAQ